MGDAGAIRDASVTIADVLEDGIDVQKVDVVLTAPDDVEGVGSPTVGLYLYDVTENPHENTLQREEVDPTHVRPGPLVVDLGYMVTAYPSGKGQGDGNQKVRTQHRLLGEAMRTLRAHAVIRGSALRGSLEDELRISPGDDQEEIVDIWNTFHNTAYLPSVQYTVGPVSLGAGEPEAAGRVESLTRRGGDE